MKIQNVNDLIKIDNIIFKKIVLFNSAQYAYFERNFDENILIEGNNNSGKTTMLNALQFVLLPEENLANFEHKFAINSGADSKQYKADETYKFYFPTDESYIIFEIENKYGIFCILLYRHNLNEKSFRRVILDCTYEEIKNLFFNEINKELIEFKRIDLLSKIKDRLVNLNRTNGYKTLTNRKEIIQNLFSITTQDNEINKHILVPLKDTKETTIDSFNILFKSLYKMSKFDTLHKKKLISEIIEKDFNSRDKSANFNFLDTKIKYQDYYKEKTILNDILNRKSEFEKLIVLYDNQPILFNKMKEDIVKIYLFLQKDNNDLQEQIKTHYIKQKELNEKQQEITKNNIEILEKLNELDKNIELNNKDLSKIKFDSLKIYKYIQDNQNLLNINFKQLSTDLEILNFLQENRNFLLNHFEEELNKTKKILNQFKTKKEEIELKTLNNVKTTIQDLEKNKSIILKKQKELQEQINNIPLYQIDDFTDEEKIKLQILFSMDFKLQKYESFSKENIKKLKDFLNLFLLTNDNKTLQIDNVNITYNIFETGSKTKLEDEHHSLILKLQNLELDIKILKENIDPIEELQLYIKQIEKNEKEIYLYQEIIPFINKINEFVITYKQLNTENLQYNIKMKEYKNDKNNLDNQIKTVENNINNIKESTKKLYSQEISNKDYLKKLENFENIEFFFKMDIESLSKNILIEIPNILDIKSEYEKFIENKNNYQKNILLINVIISKFNNTNIFNKLDEIYKNEYETNSSYQKILIEYLKEKFDNLMIEIEQNNINIKSLFDETNHNIEILKEVKNNIDNFSKKINEKFNDIQISNILKIKFDIVLNKEFIKILDKLNNAMNVNNDENIIDYIEQISNYIEHHFNNKTMIKIEHLIEDIKYSISLYKNDLNEYVFLDNSQSNGTETMINFIFMIFMFKNIYKDGNNLKLIIPVDELAKIDIYNMETLVDIVSKQNYIIVSAVPSSTPDMLRIFNNNYILIGELIKTSFSENAKLLVTNEKLPFERIDNEN